MTDENPFPHAHAGVLGETFRPAHEHGARVKPAGQVLQGRHVHAGRAHKVAAQTKKLLHYARQKRSGSA